MLVFMILVVGWTTPAEEKSNKSTNNQQIPASEHQWLEDFNKLVSEKKYEAAIKIIRLQADQGDPIAEYNLGFMYYRGQGVDQNYKETVKWYRKAAEQGFAIAQNNLGSMYYDGTGVSRDYKEAEKWFRKSADQGQPNCPNQSW